MPAIFIMPEPHTSFIPRVLKDQARANKKEKERQAHHSCNISPSWDDLPDSWDFNHYNNWDAPTTSD